MNYVVPGYIVTFVVLFAYGISLALRLRRAHAVTQQGADRVSDD